MVDATTVRTYQERKGQVRGIHPSIVCPARTRVATPCAAHVEGKQVVARSETRVLELV